MGELRTVERAELTRAPQVATLRRVCQRWCAAAVATIALAALAGMLNSAQAQERGNQPTRDAQTAAIVQLLKAPHPQVDGRVLAGIGPDVQAILIEQATAVRIEVPMRQRALAWLQYFPNQSTRAVLMEVLRAKDVSVGTLRVALRALAVGFGADALPVLREHLQHKDVFVREASAYALGDVRDRRVQAILEDQLARESELAVRDAIVASLQRATNR